MLPKNLFLDGGRRLLRSLQSVVKIIKMLAIQDIYGHFTFKPGYLTGTTVVISY